MKLKFLAVLFLVTCVQNANGSKKKSGSKMGKWMGLCALICASKTLSADSQADEFYIRNYDAPPEQKGQCFFEGCYCPHDIITGGMPVPAYFTGDADVIYNKYCDDAEFHDKNVHKVSRFVETLRFCKTLIEKTRLCLMKQTPQLKDPDFSEGDVVNQIISLKVKDTLSKWQLPEKEVKEYFAVGPTEFEWVTPGISCKETGPESCNCSCSYLALEKNDDKRKLTDHETKETKGKLTDSLYEKSVDARAFSGARTSSSMSWKRSTLENFTKEREEKKSEDL